MTRTSKCCGGSRGEGGAGVAGDDVDVGRGVADVGEDVLGDGDDGGVDFVETDAVAGLAVGRQGPGAEADDADVAGTHRCLFVEAAEAQGQADAGVGSVIGGGRAA